MQTMLTEPIQFYTVDFMSVRATTAQLKTIVIRLHCFTLKEGAGRDISAINRDAYLFQLCSHGIRSIGV